MARKSRNIVSPRRVDLNFAVKAEGLNATVLFGHRGLPLKLEFGLEGGEHQHILRGFKQPGSLGDRWPLQLEQHPEPLRRPVEEGGLSELCLIRVQEVFVRPLSEFVSLWWTFGGGTKLIIHSGPMVRPSVSLLQPSSEKLSGGPVTLACLLIGYSPQGAEVRWEVDGTEVTEGVLNSLEEEKSSRYSSSSTLMLSQENWMNAEVFSCRVNHHDYWQSKSFRKNRCEG
ncbi:immunoglobulin lambda-like polypeptide 1 [Neolamprologus brichardi]|uniref:immunoglobulin lambda-like polypeptide 1 n=1 Tax=Neolamprologus brichardi TaxID=32507 RepID=UPI001643E15E|nr:immunoglobulin lambda-like polypeptide 1 [Neolamprologus brichardi]